MKTKQSAVAWGIWVMAGVGCTVSPPDGSAQLSFDRVDVEVGFSSRALLAVDVDRDARLDLLVAGQDRVLILRGHGDGQFEASSSFRAGENPVELAGADLDGDGLTDVAVANHETNYVTLLFGVSGGGFERRDHSEFAVDVSPHPHAVRLRDIDGDGDVDLLVDDRNARSIRAFRGVGDGTFARAALINVGGDPYRGMALADLDEDGSLDLVTPNPDHIAVLMGDGAGGFTHHASPRSEFRPFSVGAADVSGDGVVDLAAASGEGVGALAVWRGSTGGSFAAAVEYEIATGPTSISTVDLTNDGRAEVLVASYAGGEVAVLRGGEPPTLHRLEVAGNPFGFATGDFDMDGRMDFAVANNTREQVSVFLSR